MGKGAGDRKLHFTVIFFTSNVRHLCQVNEKKLRFISKEHLIYIDFPEKQNFFGVFFI